VADLYHKHMTQVVPSDPYWRYNCTAYCGAMAITDATLGGTKITGRIIRAESNESTPDPRSPGMNFSQLATCFQRYRVEWNDHQGEPWSNLVDALHQGRRVILQLDYGELGNYRAQAGGDFGHAFLLIRTAPGDQVRASDPLAKAPRNYPADVLQKAARVFARSTGVPEGLRWASTRVVPMTSVDVD
jgi:hypothetical protein